jgi:hypothetical protein
MNTALWFIVFVEVVCIVVHVSLKLRDQGDA